MLTTLKPINAELEKKRKTRKEKKDLKKKSPHEGLIEVHVDFGRRLKAIFRHSFALVGGRLCVERAICRGQRRLH